MKKKSQLSTIFKSRGAAMVATVAMVVQTAFPSVAIAANELGSYNEFQLTVAAPTVSYNGDGTFDVALSGTGSASPYAWSSLGYYMRIDWDDTTVALSDTPSSGVLDTFATQNFGQSMTGNWSGEHTFLAAGTYNVVVEWVYNPNQPHTEPVLVPSASDLSNDGVRARITVPLVLTVPTQPSDEGVTVCTDENGYRATLSGTQTLSPYTWSSLGYYVRATWDDGDVTYSDTPSSNITDTFATPDFGQTLTGMWNATHTFANAGEYDVVVDLFYNPNQPHTEPVLVPSASNLANDELKATQNIHVNTDGAEPCNPPPNQDDDNDDDTPQPPAENYDITLDDVEVCSLGEGYQVTLNGTGSAGPYTWSSLGYYVNIDWMDSSTSNSDTPGSHATDTFMTPDFGATLTGDWVATHTYAASGVYNVGVKMVYNPNQPHTEPVLVPANSDLSNDVIRDTLTQEINVAEDAPACEPVVEEPGEGTVTIEKVWSFVSATPTYPEFSIMLDGNDVGITSTTSVSAAITVTEGSHTITESITGFNMALSCEATNGQATSSVAITSGEFTVNDDDAIYCIVTNTEESESNGGDGGENDNDNNNNNGPATNAFSTGSTPTTGIGDSLFNFGGPTGDVLGIQDTDEAILTCAEQYPEAALITGSLDELLSAYGFTRNTGLESSLGGALVPKILVPGAPLGSEQILQNFIVYGIQALLELGAGERAGIVASFVNLYGHLPENECDWQNVIRIGQGVVPVVVAPEREAFIEGEFAEIYDRAADRSVSQDNVTVLIMTYGLRPDVRSLSAEVQAANIFKGLYGHYPQTTSEWDIMRGIAYGGLTVPGYSPIVR